MYAQIYGETPFAKYIKEEDSEEVAFRAIAQAVLKQEPVTLPSIDCPEVMEVLRGCLAKRVVDRWSIQVRI